VGHLVAAENLAAGIRQKRVAEVIERNVGYGASRLNRLGAMPLDALTVAGRLLRSDRPGPSVRP
jgi:hypothetical protein